MENDSYRAGNSVCSVSNAAGKVDTGRSVSIYTPLIFSLSQCLPSEITSYCYQLTKAYNRGGVGQGDTKSRFLVLRQEVDVSTLSAFALAKQIFDKYLVSVLPLHQGLVLVHFPNDSLHPCGIGLRSYKMHQYKTRRGRSMKTPSYYISAWKNDNGLNLLHEAFHVDYEVSQTSAKLYPFLANR